MKRLARAAAELPPDAPHYAVGLSAGRHELRSDEPAALGGGDTGPAPYDLLMAGLASCTAITLRMYADRKGWPLAGVRVEAVLVRDGDDGPRRVERVLHLDGPLDDDQRARLADIAERTPVTRTLLEGVAIATSLG